VKRAVLDFLCCPNCDAPFSVEALVERDQEIVEGLLHCQTGKHHFPIVRSIPRILSNAFEQEEGFTRRYADLLARYGITIVADHALDNQKGTMKSFGREWTTFQVQRPEEDEAYFRSKTGTEPQSLGGKLVLDAGCGSGRYTRIAGKAGATVIGIDLSLAVETAAALTAHLPNVHVVQADIFGLPFAPQRFDFIYSIGVLHHTPDTKRALDRLIPLLKADGEIAIWLYPRWPAPVEAYNNLLRGITTHLSLDTVHKLAVVVEPIGQLKWRLLTSNFWPTWAVGRLLSGIFLGVSHHPDREIRICDTFDWFSPPYQWHHTDSEVEAWLRGYGMKEITNLSIGQKHYQYGYGNGVNFKARRPLAVRADGS
jgi:SAM-dependent methyltransferase